MSLPPEQPQPGWTPPQGPEAPGYAPDPHQHTPQQTYAGWWARLGALLLDALILTVPLLIIGFVLGAALFASGSDGEDEAATGAIIAVYGVSILLPYVYYGLTMGRDGAHNGQTLGKQIVGIRVVRENGRAIGFWWAIGRELVKGIIGTITLLINYLWPLWDKRNQALHDKLMTDVVVRA